MTQAHHAPHDAGGDPPADRAAQRIGHALLEFTRSDTQLAQERRIAAVMTAVRADSDPQTKQTTAASARFRAALGTLGGIAAMIAVMTAVVVMTPGRLTAQAAIERAITAAQSAGVRRYEIRVQPINAQAPGDAIGTLDVDGDGRILFKIKRPPRRAPGEGEMNRAGEAEYTIAGRDDQGEWAIRPDGQIERENPGRAWPEWSRIAGDTVLVAAVDDMMLALQRRFTLSKGDRPAPGQLHIHATPARPGPLPDTVDVWIDDATNLVQRLEARWSRRDHFHTDAAGADEPAAGKPRFDTPPPRLRPDGPHPTGPRPDGPRPDGPPGMAGPHHGGPHPDGPPRDGARRRPPPPRLIIFERVEAPELADEWFTPAAHTDPQ